MPALTAQQTIAELWPDHVMHKTVGKAPRWDETEGVVCACGVVLGWPVEEPPEDAEDDWTPPRETLSQQLKREAKEQVDAAREKETPRGNDYTSRPVTGAFGTYGGKPHEDVALPPDEVEVDEKGNLVLETRGTSLPTVIEDGDGEDVGHTPMPAERVDAEGKSWGPPDPDAAEEAVPHLSLMDEDEPGAGWNVGERSEAKEVADGSQQEYAAGDEAQADPWAMPGQNVGEDLPPWDDIDTPEKPSDEGIVDIPDGSTYVQGAVGAVKEDGEWRSAEVTEIGTDVVPYAGVPIMPSEGQELDPLVGRLAPLDPTQPYTPQDVELKIVSILRQVENSEEFLRQQLARLHQATHNHTMRYNLAIARSTAKAQDQRKAEAVIACEAQLKEMTEAEMLVRALRDAQHNLRSQLSGFQSVARSLGVSLVNALDGRERPPIQAESRREPPPVAPWDYQ